MASGIRAGPSLTQCRIRDVHSWAPLLGSPSPGYAIEGITNNPGSTAWRNQGLRVTGTNLPQDTRFIGPAPIIRRSRDGGWLPTALHLASFIISECADPSDYYQAEVGSALAVSLYPLPIGFQSPPLGWGGSGCLYSRTRSFPLQTRRMDKYSPL